MQGLNTFALLICRANCLLTTNYYAVENNKYSLLLYNVSIFLKKVTYLRRICTPAMIWRSFHKRLVNREFTINVYFGFRYNCV